MKILITSDLYAINTNGVVTSVKNLEDELLKKGHDVRILTVSEKSRSHKEGNVYYIRSMPIKVYGNMRMPTSYHHRFIDEIIEWKPDIIHSQCEFFSFQFAKRVSRKTNAPIVHTYHTMYEHYVSYVIPMKKLGQKLIKMFTKKRLKKVECVVAPTHKVEDALQSYGIQTDISVVPSGINLEQHHKRIIPEYRLKKRRELGISDDSTVLINLGRLGNEKNLDELVQLFAEVHKENQSLVFLIVGDGPARKNLEELAEELGVKDAVIFTGMVNPAEVHEYYQLGDLFISASTSETQGLTYIEAASNGLPLLCRQDKCLDDVIHQGENGYEFTTSEEFFTKIQNMTENEDWLKEAGRKSEEIAATFDKSAFGDAIEKLYISVLEAINE